MNKICPKCKQLKDISEFSKDLKNKDGLYYCCKKCHSKMGKIYKLINRAIIKKKRKLYLDTIKIETFSKYGGKCQCCGESNIEFLSIDHINGDGAKERREYLEKGIVYGGSKIYLDLKRRGYPSGYRVLCFNCNLSHGFFGYCPHKTPKNERTHHTVDTIPPKLPLFS